MQQRQRDNGKEREKELLLFCHAIGKCLLQQQSLQSFFTSWVTNIFGVVKMVLVLVLAQDSSAQVQQQQQQQQNGERLFQRERQMFDQQWHKEKAVNGRLCCCGGSLHLPKWHYFVISIDSKNKWWNREALHNQFLVVSRVLGLVK